MNRRNLILTAVGGLLTVVALVAVVGCGRMAAKGPAAAAQPVASDAAPVMVSTAVQGDIDQSLELTGSAEAVHQVDVVPEIGGKVIGVYADVGDHVRKGQPLLRIDTAIARANRGAVQAGISNARAKLSQSKTSTDLTDSSTAIGLQVSREQLRSAQTQLSRARTAASLVESQVNSQIEQAQHGVSSAQTRLTETKNGTRRQDIAQAKARLDSTKSAERYAKTNYDRTKGLFERGAVPQATLDSAVNGYEMAQQATAQASEALDLAKEGSRSEEIRLAEIQLLQAQESLRLAEAGRQQVEISRRDVNNAELGVSQAEQNVQLAQSNRGQVDLRQRDVEQSRAGLEQARSSLDVLDTQISKASVYAPISGIIAQRIAEYGGNINAGMGDKAFRIVDIDPIYMSAQVSELDLAKIKVGDLAKVTVDGLAGQDFLGRVRDIKPQAQQGERNYIARIAIPNAQARIKPGMFCRAHLVYGHLNNTTVISRDCLIEEGSTRQVYAVVDDTIQVRPVKVAAISGTTVAIAEGVKPGDVLVSTGQKLLADGQKVKPTEKSATDETAGGAAAEAPQ
jgi:RND family efflux transporter MFP subunit